MIGNFLIKLTESDKNESVPLGKLKTNDPFQN